LDTDTSEVVEVAPRMASRPQLTQEQIVSAAMGLIDELGLAGHSMRRLGAELGVDPSTIYYHVPSKAALYDLVVDEVLNGIDLSVDDPSASLEERVVTAGLEYRRALLRHPRTVPLVAVRALRTPAQLRPIEAFSRIFFDAGFSPVEAMIAVDTCGTTILGATNMHAASLSRSEYHEQETSQTDFTADAFPPGQYPNLTRMFPAGASLGAGLEFERAMRALALGLLALHAAGTLAPTDSESRGEVP
jgi:AcrR family transcriptional regulator